MKNLVSSLIFGVVCFLLYLVLEFVINLLSGLLPFSGELISLVVQSLIITFFILGVTYGWIWSKNTFTKTINIFIFLLTTLVLISFAYLLIFINFESGKLYKYLTAKQSYGITGKVFQADDTLGFKAIPDCFGYQTSPIGEGIPLRYDKYGFRVPVNDSIPFNPEKPVDIMFFGCSWTMAYPCYAEESFSYLVAKGKNYNYINAGGGGYGLSQMLILANKLIPKYKPSNIVIQYSPWLADRSTSIYVPSYYGYVPSPYFIYKDNTFSLSSPLFKTQIYDIDKEKIREEFSNHYFKFYVMVGIPFYLKEIFNDTKAKISLWLKPELKPATNKDEVEKFAYTEMAKLAHENGAKVIILNIGDVLEGPKYSVYEKGAPKKILNIADVKYTQKSKHLIDPSIPVEFAQADSMLIDYLNNSESKNYIKEFGNWRFDGKDSVFVDGHPNPKAHRIIAKSILLKLIEQNDFIQPNN